MTPDIYFMVYAHVRHVRQNFGTCVWSHTAILKRLSNPALILKLSSYLPVKFVNVLKSRLIFNIFCCFWMFANEALHISRAHISKSKSCFNEKSSTHYLHMKTKILAYFQICVGAPLKQIPEEIKKIKVKTCQTRIKVSSEE